MATSKTSLLATSLCGAPVALQIYLIVQARSAERNHHEIAWPIAHKPNYVNHEERACKVVTAPERYTASISRHSDVANESTMQFYHPGTDTVVLPVAGLFSQTSESHYGWRSIQEGKPSLRNAQQTLYDHHDRANSQARESSLSQTNQNRKEGGHVRPGHARKPVAFKSAEDLRVERQRHALSAETAVAISQARSSTGRACAAGVLPPQFMWPTRKETTTRESAIVSEMLTGQPCHEGDVEPFVEKRKDSVISFPTLPERRTSQLGFKYVEKMVWLMQPTQAAFMIKGWEYRSEVARREKSARRYHEQ